MKSKIYAVLLIVATAGISQFSLADNHLPTRHIHTQDAEVRYIPGKAGELRFNVICSNASGNHCSLTILDENGDQLYQENFTDKNFNKTFRLVDPDITGKLIFVIRNFDDNTTQRFEAHTVDRYVEDVEVREVK